MEKRIAKTTKKIEKFEWKHRNLSFFLISIALAYFILKSNYIQVLIAHMGTFGYLGSLIAGLFFSYGLTVIPAMATLLILAENLNPFLIALFGAVGATAGNYLIFRFIGNRLILAFEEIADDISHPLKKYIEKIRRKSVKSKAFQRLVPIIAGFIIASPLPDELIAVLFGSVKFELRKFLIYAFVLHFIGIFIIATIGKTF